jgi:C-terminal processing protease CtpA/Prc
MKKVRIACTAIVLIATAVYAQQQFTNNDRARGRTMLRSIKDEIKKYYYDPQFHGIDVEARFATSEKQLEGATSNGQMFGIIAQTLLDFDDSHLYFQPPPRQAHVEYGWRYQAIGDKVYVTAVKPGSDAAAKGLVAGDVVLKIDSFLPDRANAWKLRYLYGQLLPRPGVRMIVQSPDDQPRELEITADVKQLKRRVDLTNDADFWAFVRDLENDEQLNRHRYYELDDVVIWKMPAFDLEDRDMRGLMKKASNRKALILDLRGNPGGSVEVLQKVAGSLFDHDVQIAEVHKRKDIDKMMAKSWGSSTFTGKLVVLVDSDSASSSEVLARLVQLEKRGTVIGDRTAGAVMRSRQTSLQVGAESIVPYGLSVTDADVIMSDGKSLEKTGVTPDEIVIPTAKDLAAGHDPVLARAAKILAVELDAAKAGSMFPIEWPKQ